MSRRHILTVLCGVGLVAGAVGLWSALTARLTPARVPQQPSSQATPHHADDEPPPESRRTSPAVATDDAKAADAMAQAVDFDQLLDEIVHIGVTAIEARSCDDMDAWRLGDQRGRELFEELTAIRDADERALYVLTGMTQDKESPADSIRRAVCRHVVGNGLALRLSYHRQGQSRGSLNELTSNMLASVPNGERVAEDLTKLLTNQPYLGPPHEGAVLDLVELASEQPKLTPHATALLLTLWRNLEGQGGRNMAALALLFRQEKNRSKRLAAFQHLLTAEQGRYRDLILQQVIDQGDREVAQELAVAMAKQLDGKAALHGLRKLQQLPGLRLLNAYALLGSREPDALCDSYEDLLARSVQPQQRADLITGATVVPSAAGMRLAMAVVDEDPSATVQGRALLAICAHGESGLASKALLRKAQQRPDDAHWSSTLVDALQNLADRCGPNRMRKIGLALQARSKMLGADRKRLDRLLTEGLPKPQLPESIRRKLR